MFIIVTKKFVQLKIVIMFFFKLNIIHNLLYTHVHLSIYSYFNG
jgi:hypothetical protein